MYTDYKVFVKNEKEIEILIDKHIQTVYWNGIWD